MPVITDLLQQKHQPGRVNIHVDGTFAFGASEQFVVEHGLRINKELTTDEYKKLQEDVIVDAAYQSCLNYLSFRPRSIAETNHYIRRKYPQFSEGIKVSITNRLMNIGLLDDETFARWWVQQRREVSARSGPYKIRQELIAKGVESDVIEKVMCESQHIVSDKDLVLRQLVKLQRKYPDMRPFNIRTKVMNTLARKGFSWDLVKETVEEFVRD